MSAHILIVDDNKLNLKLATAVLEKEGYKTSTAINGYEALAKATDQPPDLAILDIMMPDMDGYELCQRMRENPTLKNMPIIILTALSSVEDRLKAFEVGADDFLSKPFIPAELVARVNVLFRHIRSGAVQVQEQSAYKIAVFSLRGGVGVSTLATNLAAGLTQLWNIEDALLDLALVNGQSALMFDLPLRNTWSDLGNIPVDELDISVINQVMLRHSCGTHILAAPRHAADADLISGEKAQRVIDILEKKYPYLIFDLPHDFAETTIAALDSADKILLLLSPEMASIRTAGMALKVFDDLDYPEEKTDLVLNWNFKNQGLPKSEIETALKKEIKIVMPFIENTMVTAITMGKPPILAAEEKPLRNLLEDMTFYWSNPKEKKTRPAAPTEFWKRTVKRLKQRTKNK